MARTFVRIIDSFYQSDQREYELLYSVLFFRPDIQNQKMSCLRTTSYLMGNSSRCRG